MRKHRQALAPRRGSHGLRNDMTSLCCAEHAAEFVCWARLQPCGETTARGPRAVGKKHRLPVNRADGDARCTHTLPDIRVDLPTAGGTVVSVDVVERYRAMVGCLADAGVLVLGLD